MSELLGEQVCRDAVREVVRDFVDTVRVFLCVLREFLDLGRDDGVKRSVCGRFLIFFLGEEVSDVRFEASRRH